MAKNQELKSLIGRIKFIHGLTQAQIADELSVQSTYLSDMVNGRVPFSEKFREKLNLRLPILFLPQGLALGLIMSLCLGCASLSRFSQC